MVVLEATVDAAQIERELEQVEGPEVEVEGEMTAGPGIGGDSDGATGALATIGRRLTLILGALGVLAQLDTILEILDGIFRAVEVALLPLIGLITAFLRPVLDRLLRLFADFSFDDAFAQLEQIIGETVDAIGEDISQIVTSPSEFASDTERDFRRFGGELQREFGDNQLLPGFDTTTNDVLGLLGGNEFSNSGLKSVLSNGSQEDRTEDSPGGR